MVARQFCIRRYRLIILCNVCLVDWTSLTKMQQNSGKVARNIASGNKIKNDVFNFVTEYFLVLGYAPVVYFFGLWSWTLYFLITIRAVQKQKWKRRCYQKTIHSMNELGFSGVPVSYFLNRSKDQNEKKAFTIIKIKHLRALARAAIPVFWRVSCCIWK